MSLRARLLVLMTLLNLLVLGVISVTTVVVQDRWAQRLTAAHLDVFRRYYDNFLTAGTSTESDNSERVINTVQAILRLPLRDRYRDILIRSAAVGGHIDLNPFGAAHRDHRTFPLDEISDGIGEAMRTRAAVSAGGGRCVAIISPDGTVEGGVWFVPMLPSRPEVSFWPYAIPLLGSLVLFALLAGWVVGSTLGPPLGRLGAAARRVEAGDYAARVPAMSAPELATVGEAFNAMARKVEGHTAELQREVQRATEEAAAKERALVQSSRLASMGTLAAGIAHEINNPIGGMLNAVNRLAGAEHLSDRDRTYLDLVRRGLERVARTSRKLLDFSPKLLDVVEFRLGDAVEGARALVEHQLAQQGVTLDVDLPGDLPRLLGEPHELQQVMLNLFLNSLNAMREGGGTRIEVRAARRGSELEVTVRDDGPGVDAATLEQVMNPFFSGSNRPDSSGLGLFICFTIIRNHGGDIAVRSAPGEGFEVGITLPLAPAAKPA